MNAAPRTLLALGAGLALGIGVCWIGLTVLRDSPPTVAVAPQRPSSQKSTSAAPSPPPASMLFPSLADTPREFRPMQAAELATWAELQKAFWATTDESERLEMLDRMEEELYSAEILSFLKKLFESPDAAISNSLRERALEMLSGNISAEILVVLEAALRRGDEDIRSRAILAAGQVRSGEMATFISRSFTDDSPTVRLNALDALEHQTTETRNRVFEKALSAPYPDVALQALGELQVDARAGSIPLIIKGMNAPLPEVREEATLALEFLFDQHFENATQAMNWWAANQKRYDKDLVEKSPSN